MKGSRGILEGLKQNNNTLKQENNKTSKQDINNSSKEETKKKTYPLKVTNIDKLYLLKVCENVNCQQQKDKWIIKSFMANNILGFYC